MLVNPLMIGVAIASFVSIFVLHLPFPLIVLAAAILGLLGDRIRAGWFEVGVERELEDHEQAAIRDDAAAGEHTRPSTRRTVAVLVIGLAAGSCRYSSSPGGGGAGTC